MTKALLLIFLVAYRSLEIKFPFKSVDTFASLFITLVSLHRNFSEMV